MFNMCSCKFMLLILGHAFLRFKHVKIGMICFVILHGLFGLMFYCLYV